MRIAIVRPAIAGDLIPMPERPLPADRFEILPQEGREVDVEWPFWAARLRDGSVVEVIPEPPAPEVEPAPQPEPAPHAPADAKD